MFEKWDQVVAKARREFIYGLLKEFGPMTVRTIAQKMSEQRFEGYGFWSPANLSDSLQTLKMQGRIGAADNGRTKPRLWAAKKEDGAGVA